MTNGTSSEDEDNEGLGAIGIDVSRGHTSNKFNGESTDDKARKEEQEFEFTKRTSADYATVTDDDLRRQNKKHTYALRSAFNQIFVWAIRIAGMALILLFLVRIWHIAGPVTCQWMTDDAVKELDKIFLGGALGGFLTRHLEKVISPS